MTAAKDLKKQLDEHEYLTVNEVARRTTYHPIYIRRLISDGKLKSKKINGKRVIPLRSFIEFCNNGNK